MRVRSGRFEKLRSGEFRDSQAIKRRKRHIVVDTLGLLLAVSVTAASVQDRDAAPAVVAQAVAKAPGLQKLCTDSAYGGQCAFAIEQARPKARHTPRLVT